MLPGTLQLALTHLLALSLKFVSNLRKSQYMNRHILQPLFNFLVKDTPEFLTTNLFLIHMITSDIDLSWNNFFSYIFFVQCSPSRSLTSEMWAVKTSNIGQIFQGNPGPVKALHCHFLCYGATQQNIFRLHFFWLMLIKHWQLAGQQP